MKRPDVVCAVLAGGLGRRIGAPKATVQLAGRPLISFPLAAASEAELDSVVIAKRDTPLPDLDAELITEPDEPRHPLCGIVTALRASEGRAVVVLGCDMPLVAPSLLAHLAELPAALAVCEAGGRLQPLLGRYEPSLLPHLSSALEEEWALTEAVSALEPRVVREAELKRFGDPATLTFNVNTQADLRSAEARLRVP